MLGGRRTRIIATIGPASSSVRALRRMIKAGMRVARLNFSHGTHEQHARLIRHIRQASKSEGISVAILQDLQGPKIRVGDLSEDGYALKQHEQVVLRTGDVVDEGEVPVAYPDLHKDVKKGHRIFLDDGRMELVVERTRGRRIYAKVKNGGILHARKGINIPDSQVSTSSFTKKDHKDLMFGLEQGVDWVALSFVTSADVVEQVRRSIRAKNRTVAFPPPKLLSKIERQEAVDAFEDILKASDGIMLARGDLGIEIPAEEVPIVQKEFVERCRQAGKPVVVATHMLDSMTASPRATRAEISDVANAVIDHADAVMLSAETATGEYPSVAVSTMARVIEETEASRLDDVLFYQLSDVPDLETSIAQSLHLMAENGQIQMIVSSQRFPIADRLNIFRPNVPIVLVCTDAHRSRQALLRAGVEVIVLDDDPATFVHRVQRSLRQRKWVKKTDHIAYVVQSASGEVQIVLR